MSRVEPTQELLDRRVDGMGQVDRLLGLCAGTARRWIDGYTRAGVSYDPVVRQQPTGVDVVTWGEFIEVRLLSEYRDAGVRAPGSARPWRSPVRTSFTRDIG